MKSIVSPIVQGAMALFLIGVAGTTGSHAGEHSEFQEILSRGNGHYRVAVNYLRTGNVDFAAIELEGMIENWKSLELKARDEFPAPYDNDPNARRNLLEVGELAVSALAYIDDGKPKQARRLIKPIRSMLHNLRARNGIYLLEDCLYEASRAFAPLYAYKGVEPDFALPGDGAKLLAAAAGTASKLSQCDAMASSETRKNEAFRRLIDGSLASMARIPDAVETVDNALLYRVLIEMKSFDRLLFFRYG